ncbi:hypothetical protein M569_12146, partial [Genlisea aurea]
AAPRTYYAPPSHRFLPSDPSFATESMDFELDESEVWNSDEPGLVNSTDSDPCASIIGSLMKPPASAASLPVNVPDWSKILKEEYYTEKRCGDGEDVEDVDYGEEKLPPHEFLARARITSFSVHEGIGRTLKGRDLRRVRNAIWQKTGFLD